MTEGRRARSPLHTATSKQTNVRAGGTVTVDFALNPG